MKIAIEHPHPPSPKALSQRFLIAEWGLCIGMTLVGVWLHLVFLTHAGGLWRDEAGAVRLATLPTFSETWSQLGHESSPVLFPGAIRIWSVLGWDATDSGLRAFGFLVGILLLAGLWLNAGILSRSAPVISLGLLAVNMTVVRWGDSLRAYGMGSVFMLTTLGMVWRYVCHPNRNRWILATVASVLSAQCLFQNGALILAVSLAAALVSQRRGSTQAALEALAIGAISTASYLPYLKIINGVKGWSMLNQTGFIPRLVWENLSAAAAPVAPWTKWIWIALGAFALAEGFKRMREIPPAQTDDAQMASAFAGTALIAGTLGFVVFLWITALPTQEWYFLPWLSFAAVCIDAALANGSGRLRCWRLALPCLMIGLVAPHGLHQARTKQTNMDLIAAELNRRAAPNDLILVHPWYLGISFDRYYHGTAPWTTIPALEDHRFHRYDLLKVKLQQTNPIQPILDQVGAVLRSGHQVWMLGWIPLDGGPAPEVNPAPNNPWGWMDEPYSEIWGMKLGNFIENHSRGVSVVVAPTNDNVSSFENLPLGFATGWRADTEALPSR